MGKSARLGPLVLEGAKAARIAFSVQIIVVLSWRLCFPSPPSGLLYKLRSKLLSSTRNHCESLLYSHFMIFTNCTRYSLYFIAKSTSSAKRRLLCCKNEITDVSILLLASFSLFRELHDDRKNVYDVTSNLIYLVLVAQVVFSFFALLLNIIY